MLSIHEQTTLIRLPDDYNKLYLTTILLPTITSHVTGNGVGVYPYALTNTPPSDLIKTAFDGSFPSKVTSNLSKLCRMYKMNFFPTQSQGKSHLLCTEEKKRRNTELRTL